MSGLPVSTPFQLLAVSRLLSYLFGVFTDNIEVAVL